MAATSGEWEDDLNLAAFGGRGSGKTAAGAMRLLAYVATWPGCNTIVTAPNYKKMNRSTLPALKKILKVCGLREGVHYNIHINNYEIHWWNESVTYLASTDDEDSSRGIDAAAGWMDEGCYSSFESFTNLQGTLRQPGYPHQFWMTTTPLGKRNWAYQIFYPEQAQAAGYDEYDVEDVGSGRYAPIHARTRDNPFGGEQLHQKMIRLYGENSLIARQELNGEFVLLEGLVYPDWDSEMFALPRERWPLGCNTPSWRPDRIAMAADYGGRHNSALLVGGMDHFGRQFLLDEWAKPSEPKEVAAEAVRLAKKWGAVWCFCEHDPTWFRPLREALGGVGVHATRAEKHYGEATDPDGAIGMITGLLNRKMPDGGPGLIVDRDHCGNFIREMENYQWPDEKDGKPLAKRPLKVKDDSVDTHRYLYMGMVHKLRWDEPERIRTVQVSTEFVGAGAR